MKTKHIPALVMLLGCAVAAIVTYINGYSFLKMLKILLLVLFIFLFIGLFIQRLFNKYIPYIEEEEVTEDEGSVIEKTSDETLENESNQNSEVISEESLEEEQAENV